MESEGGTFVKTGRPEVEPIHDQPACIEYNVVGVLRASSTYPAKINSSNLSGWSKLKREKEKDCAVCPRVHVRSKYPSHVLLSLTLFNVFMFVWLRLKVELHS